ncbi:MAG: deoxyribonuclease IV, partial [SAR202 cluster bacterium]|nr:deoxyribonuclease IV [SAR202 cluster bacterium]
SLINYMNLAAEIGADGVTVHPGSHGGRGFETVLPHAAEAIKTVLDASPGGPCLAVENMAGMGQHIGAKFDELGRILDAVDSPRLKIYLDTQHAFAAGYDLTNPQEIQDMLAELDSGTGSANVAAVHTNDSKRVCGSGVDRHDNTADGFIGEEGFVAIMANPAFAEVPFLLEVPGFEGKGPDQQNMDILKKIGSQVGLSS